MYSSPKTSAATSIIVSNDPLLAQGVTRDYGAGFPDSGYPDVILSCFREIKEITFS